MDMKIILILLLAFEFIDGKRMSKRVIKGENAPEDKYRWAISLKGDLHKEKGVTLCGATLIDKQWLLSAAHCFLTIDGLNVSDQTNPSLWHIRAGARRLQTQYVQDEDENKQIKERGWHEDQSDEDILFDNLFKNEEEDNFYKQKVKIIYGHIHLHIEKLWLHPNYRGDQIEWDIAIMKLKHPIDEKYINKSVEIIGLPEKSDSKICPKVGQKCVLIGWGCQSSHGNVAEYGQLASLKVITNSYCEQVYEQRADLNKNHEFCAGSYQSGHGVCEGDSGSGLACQKESKWVLAGVASATHADNPANFPGLFTRVSYFIPWIKDVMKNN